MRWTAITLTTLAVLAVSPVAGALAAEETRSLRASHQSLAATIDTGAQTGTKTSSSVHVPSLAVDLDQAQALARAFAAEGRAVARRAAAAASRDGSEVDRAAMLGARLRELRPYARHLVRRASRVDGEAGADLRRRAWDLQLQVDELVALNEAHASEPTSGESVAFGAISGHVLDASSQLPIEGVGIELYQASGDLVAFAITDEKGAYSSDSVLAPGTYYATSENALGYLDELYDDVDCGLGCYLYDGTPIVVAPGEIVSDIDFALVKGGSVAGEVTDAATGDGIPGVLVEIYDSSGWLRGTAMSDASGAYALRVGLPAGDYYALTRNGLNYIDELYDGLPCYGYCWPTDGTAIAVTLGQVATGVDFALQRAGAIAGTVTDALTGAPLYGMSVEVFDSSGTWLSSSYTSLGGHYSTGLGLPPGSYFAIASGYWGGRPDELYQDLPCDALCDVTSGTPIPVSASLTTTGIDFTLDLGGAIQGRVIDAATGKGVAGAEVDFAGPSYEWVITNEQGFYHSGFALRPGTYTVFTYNYYLPYADELYDDIACEFGCDQSLGTPVNVAAARVTTGIDFELERMGGISGEVTLSQRGSYYIVEVDIYDQEGRWVDYEYFLAPGQYSTTERLLAGTYFAVAYVWDLAIPAVLFDGIPCGSGCTVTKGTPISIESGLITPNVDFDFQLPPPQIFDDGFESGDLSAWSWAIP